MKLIDADNEDPHLFDKVDKDVLDGNSFSLSINFGEDKSISAHGYMKYPSGYREKTDSIKYWFSKIDKTNQKTLYKQCLFLLK